MKGLKWKSKAKFVLPRQSSIFGFFIEILPGFSPLFQRSSLIIKK